MNRRRAIRTLICAGAGSAFTRLNADTPSDQPGDLIIHSDVRLVLLDVSAKNRKGGFVQELTRENFKVFENGQRQQITVFEHNDLPVTVGIIVDESRSMSPKRGAVLTAALTFIGESNPSDEVFVLNFNDDVTAGLPSPQLFSGNREELRAALFRGVSQGRTALYDAVIAGLEQLEHGKRDKKALVLISDGGDNASRHTRQETLGRIEASIATIHTVGLFDTDDIDRDPGILRKLAQISGGEAYFPDNPPEMVPVCRRIAHDIRMRYTIGYHPPAGKRTNDIRHIRVEASSREHGALITRTRSSYRYDEIQTEKRK